MCGIAGYVLQPQSQYEGEGFLTQAYKTLHHRGPDAQAHWSDETVGLAHTRLAIVDLSTDANQPMLSNCGRYRIVYNGEVYNWHELREELQQYNVQLRTQSDTEVLLEAFRVWGEAMLPKLRGMFAFAIWDAQTRELFCARDTVGKKPFVYAETKQGVFFASEIPALLQAPDVNLALRHEGLAAMLLHNMRHIPDPYTVYRGMSRLPAGHAMRIKDGHIEQIWRWWEPSAATAEPTAENLRALLEDCVRLRMRADVPVGALLSGGVDSTSIVALMKQHTEQPIRTYALGRDAEDEDLVRARAMAEQLGTEHREFYFQPEAQLDRFTKLQKLYGEPIMLLPLAYANELSEAISADGVKVVMVGHGADELFYGYTGYKRMAMLTGLVDWLPIDHRARKAHMYSRKASIWQELLQVDVAENLAEEQMRYWGALSPSGSLIDASNFVGLMVENTHSVTTAADLPGMAASIECRAPFLDKEMLAFAFATHFRQKVPSGADDTQLKAILKDAVKDLMPHNILYASKRGFGMGIQENMLLEGPWQSQMRARLLDQFDDMDGLFNTKAVRQKLEQSADASLLMKLFAMQLWRG